MGKLRRGQRLNGIPSNDWNRFVDAADIVLGGQQRLGLAGGGVLGGQTLVYVKNNSGSDVARFRALGIGGVQIEPSDDLEEFQAGIVLDGETPLSSTHIGRFAVAQEFIEAGAIGIAAISGLTVVEVDVPPTDHGWPFVDIKDSTELLTASWHGAAEIVAGPWTHDSKRWAIARLGNYQAPLYKAVVTETGGIAAGSSGDADIQINGVAKETITAHLNWLEGTNSADENAEVLVRYFRDEQKWVIVALEGMFINNPSNVHLLRATLSANLCSSDATASINNVEVLSGWLGATPTSVVNGQKLAGTTGDILYAVRRPSTANWEIINVQHVQNEYLEKMVEPSEVTTADITSIDAGQDPADPGCDYKFRRLKTPMIKEPIGAGSCVQEAFDEINFTPQAVLTDLRYGQDASGNPCIDGKVKIVWSPDQCDEIPDEWVNVICGTECPTGA